MALEALEISHRIPLTQTISSSRTRDSKSVAQRETQTNDFSSMLAGALEGINALQTDAQNKAERALLGDESVEAHDVTLAMLKANFALNLAKTVAERAIGAYKELTTPR